MLEYFEDQLQSDPDTVKYILFTADGMTVEEVDSHDISSLNGLYFLEYNGEPNPLPAFANDVDLAESILAQLN